MANINKDGWRFVVEHHVGETDEDGDVNDTIYINIFHDKKRAKKVGKSINLSDNGIKFDGPSVIIDIDENGKLMGIEVV